MKQRYNPFTAKKVVKELERMARKDRVSKSRTTASFLPHDQTAYFFYRKNRKTNNPIGEHRTRFKEAVTEIYNAVSELMFENEGGVYLEEYGYFSPMEIKFIKTDLKKRRNYLNSNNKDFGLQLFTEVSPKSCIKYMVMDRSFSTITKKRFAAALMVKRHKPKLFYTLLMSLYSNKKI